MNQFVISKRTPDKFEIVNGTKLTDEFFAHNAGTYTRWVVSDIKSGRALQSKFPSLAACKEFVANVPADIQEQINSVRKLKEYQYACDELYDFVSKNMNPIPKYYTPRIVEFNKLFDDLSGLYD